MGFDIERHDYGNGGYPGQLVVQDVLTLHGSQFKSAALIVASPPCQWFSYTSFPFMRSKALAERARSEPEYLADRLKLFEACFRIQREASEAAGKHIPMVVENVVGAQPWAGNAQGRFGSFFLWGDVPALMIKPHSRRMKYPTPCSDRLGTEPDNRSEGVKGSDGYERNHPTAFGWKKPSTSSRSHARKAAAAKVAMIPLALSRWIDEWYFPGR